jgi:hypothetical protein
MSTDRMSVAVLEDFIKKVRLNSKSGQKEMKIPTQDAENLVHNLSLILLRLADRDQPVSTKEEVIQIVMDGGGLDDKR